MNFLKHLIAYAIVAAMVCSASLSAQPYTQTQQEACFAESAGGCGYVESTRSPYLAPSVALGTIALVAIIAVAVQNSHHSHSHAHD